MPLRFLVLSSAALAAMLLMRSAEADDGCVVRFAPEEETRRIDSLQPYDGALLVGSERGLFRFDGTGLRRLAPEEETGAVGGLYPLGDTLLVGAANALFRLDGAGLRRLVSREEAGWVYGAYLLGDALLLHAEKGLFRFDDTGLHQLAFEAELGWFAEFLFHGDALLIGTISGLFRFDGSGLHRLASQEETGGISGFLALDGAVLVGGDKGLFRLDGTGLRRLAPETETGWIASLHSRDELLLVGSRRGLFRLDGTGLRRLASETETGAVHQIGSVGETLLLSADMGLFRLDGSGLRRLASEKEIGAFYVFHPQGDVLLVGTDQGLFRLDGARFRSLLLGDEIGWVRSFGFQGDTLLAGTDRGLFRVHLAAPLNAAQALPEWPIVDASTGNPVPFRFTVRHPCVSEWRRDRITLLPAGGGEFAGRITNVTVEPSGGDPSYAVVSGQIVFERGGTNRMRLAVAEDDGAPVPVGEAIEIRVDWAWSDHVKSLARQVWPFLLGMHTLLFVGLIVGARWSDRCWRLVADPVWGRIGLWFHVALRHSGVLQRWIMARWFDRVRRSLAPSPYLPVPLTVETGEEVASTELLDRLREKRCLWLQGNPGMGKTKLTTHLAEQYFADPELPSLFAAYRRFGFVPIFISLREFAAIRPDSARPALWVPELARAAVAVDGVAFGDATLFRAILVSGDFALVLDGANEVGYGRELELFAKETPAARVLVTSQVLPAYAPKAFEVLRLPATIREVIRPLLSLFLGKVRGDEIFGRVAGSSLFDSIQSGYDVRLLADLVTGGPDTGRLPDDRHGLYDAILAAVRMPDGSPYPLEQLCGAAWRMWRDDQRKLKADGTYLRTDLLEPLRDEGNRVLRTFDGETFEFRHDQMRGYLAAQWAVVHEVAPVRLFEADAEIWRRARCEQEMVWGFAAGLVDPEQGAELWRWATRDPERVVLQHALQERGEREGWPLLVHAGPDFDAQAGTAAAGR